MDEAFELNEGELREAMDLIQRRAPGVYTARKLYGSLWAAKSPTSFGPRFKHAVKSGKLEGITHHPDDTSAHSAQYVVHGG